MQQHAVPQHISSYEFRLIGDMTLKQFFQVAAGFLLALLVYVSPIPEFFKWFLILFFVLLGLALAFLPLEGRPLEMWILAFFRAVYSPTKFFWNRQKSVREFYAKESEETAQPSVIAPQGREVMEAYLKSRPTDGQVLSLEKQEATFLNKVSALLRSQQPVQQMTSPQKRKDLKIPSNTPTKIIPDPLTVKKAQVEKQAQQPVQQVQQLGQQAVTPIFSQGSQQNVSQQAKFSLEAAPPNPPTTPNIVVGQVLDSQGKIAQNVILEIKDEAGRPVRAVKSNPVGHFMIVTPLLNGKYELIAEKEGLKFDPVTFQARGEIIPPIMVKAKKTSNPSPEVVVRTNQNTNPIPNQTSQI